MPCTTLTNNQVINSPTHACTGTVSNITVNSDLYIDSGITLTINGSFTVNSGGHLYVNGKLITSGTAICDGDVDITGGTGTNGQWTTSGASATITLNGSTNLYSLSKLSCNSTFANNGLLYVVGNAVLTALKGCSFTNTTTTDPGSVLNLGTSTSPNSFTTTWSGTDHYLGGKVFDYNAVTVSAGYFELKCCKFRTGNFTFSGSLNAIATPFSAYMEIIGTGTGTTAMTGDVNISVYKSGGGSLNTGSATVLGAAKSPSPC